MKYRYNRNKQKLTELIEGLSLNSIVITVLRFNNRKIICSSKINKESEYVMPIYECKSNQIIHMY